MWRLEKYYFNVGEFLMYPYDYHSVATPKFGSISSWRLPLLVETFEVVAVRPQILPPIFTYHLDF